MEWACFLIGGPRQNIIVPNLDLDLDMCSQGAKGEETVHRETLITSFTGRGTGPQLPDSALENNSSESQILPQALKVGPLEAVRLERRARSRE